MSSTLVSPTDVSMLFITVVVPVLNEEGFIAQTLDGLLEQDYPEEAFEVLVVDGESDDRTSQIVGEYSQKHPNVKLLSNPKKWSSAARNIGISSAAGDVVIVVDGHCQFFDDQYLKHVEAAFRRNDIDCLGRPQPLDVTDGSTLQESIALARASRLGHHPDSFIYADREQIVPAHSVGVAYRKTVFDKIGKFDEVFDACEDVELNHRVDKAGMNCLLVPNIRLRYYPRSSVKGLFRQMTRYGRGRVRLFRKHAETFSVKSFLPAIFLACVVLGGIAVCFLPVLRLPYFAVVGLYLAIVFGFSILLGCKASKPHLALVIPAVFMAIHFGAGYGTLKEVLCGKQAK